jgi:hypothetical protein
MNIFGVHQEHSFIDGSLGQFNFCIYTKCRKHQSGVRIFSESNFIDLQEGIYDDIIRGIGWRYGRTNTSNVSDVDPGIKHYILVNLDVWNIKEFVGEYGGKFRLETSPQMRKFLEDAFPRIVSFYRSYQIEKILSI